MRINYHHSEETKKKIAEKAKGRKISEKTREKLRLCHIGYVPTPEQRRKISESERGSNHYNFGKHRTKEVIEKLRKANTGKKASEETKKKMSESLKGRKAWNKGIPLTLEMKKKISNALKGHNVPISARIKASERMKGDKCPFWRGGVSSQSQIIHQSMEYKRWRKSVFIRDDYVCQSCGQTGGYLEAHHLKSFSEYPELRFIVENGQTLCKSCHGKTDNYGSKNRANGLPTKPVLVEDGEEIIK